MHCDAYEVNSSLSHMRSKQEHLIFAVVDSSFFLSSLCSGFFFLLFFKEYTVRMYRLLNESRTNTT